MMKIRDTLNRTLVGLGILLGATQLSAEKLVITTGDCGDGTPGLGADGWLSENREVSLRGKSGTGKMSPFVMVRANDKRQDIGYFRFDLSELNGRKVKSAKLQLYAMTAYQDWMTVAGLADGIKGKNVAGSEDVNDHDDDQHDEFFREKLMDRQSAPGMEPSDGDLTTIDWKEGAVFALGEFQNTGVEGLVEFQSPELAVFVNADTNGVITLYLKGDIHSFRYASKENPEGNLAPTLVLELAPSL
ncbi:MAG: hypothetical protein P8M62_08925 [Opitutae bacterium]|jgi:hypothetical protein|nr:hypothetical protein [Opitutae bacterium]